MQKHYEIDEVVRWYPTEFNDEDCKFMWEKKGMNLYVHIPFCKGKCGFCPFNSQPITNKNLDEYFSMLKKEIMLYAQEPYFKERYIRSLWIGGGTPSAVPFERLKEILNILMEQFNFRDDTEITLETNLFDLNENYIKTVANSPVTRLSIGVQSFNDKYLKMMGRTYRREWIDEFFKFIKKYKLDISIDVMYRYPGQTVEEVREDMRSIVSMSDSIDHITLYSLILFPKLSIYKLVKNGKLPKQPSLETYYEMNKALTEELQKNGPYVEYTTNHFAKPGKENIYNLDRWGFPQKECLSFGPGAFSQVKDYVYCNEHKLEDYYTKLKKNIKPVQSGKKMTLIEQISRYLVLGCKNLEVNLDEFSKLVGLNIMEIYPEQIKQLTKSGLIKIENNKLQVTPDGKAWILDISKAFFTDNNKNFTQPQYDILDMFEGKRNDYINGVVDEK